jgi:hypothetical protein
MMRPLLWNENQMCMGDSVAIHQEADALRRERYAKAGADMLRHEHDALSDGIGNISEMIDVRPLEL